MRDSARQLVSNRSDREERKDSEESNHCFDGWVVRLSRPAFQQQP